MKSCTPTVSSTRSKIGSRWFVKRLAPRASRIELRQRRVWLGLRNSVRSASLKATRSPTWCPWVCVMVTRSPARIRHIRAWPAGIANSRSLIVPRPLPSEEREAIVSLPAARGRRLRGRVLARVALPVARVLDDAPQELDDDLGGEQRGVVGGHVEHRIDLDQVEADHLPAPGDGEEGLA